MTSASTESRNDMDRVDAPRGHEQVSKINDKRRLTGSFGARNSAIYGRRLSNLSGAPPGERKAPVSAGTDARADLSKRADRREPYSDIRPFRSIGEIAAGIVERLEAGR